MDRRKFLTTSSALGAAAITGCSASPPPEAAAKAPPPKSTRMHVGCQRSPTTVEMLQNFKRHGVNHICGYPPDPGTRGYWTVEELAQTRELCEKHGVELEMVALPFLASSHIDREKRGAIMLGQSPERDKDIDDIHKMIEACAKVGVPSFKYNMSLLGVVRIESTPGRGGDQLKHMAAGGGKTRPAADARRRGQRRPVLGADHVFFGPCDPGGERVQGAGGVSSA